MKKLTVLITIACLLLNLVSCAGIGKNPRTYQPVKETDNIASCNQYKMEIESVLADFKSTDQRYNGTVAWNCTMGFLGGLFILPLLAVDLSDTEMKEMDQQAMRYNNLIDMCKEKECGFEYKKLEKVGRMGGWKFEGGIDPNETTPKSEPTTAAGFTKNDNKPLF